MSYLKIPEWPFKPDEQAPINEEWEARESAFDNKGNLKRQRLPTPNIIPDIEPYVSPLSEDGIGHEIINTRPQRMEDMKRADCIDPRDVPKTAYHERIRKARGWN